MPTYDYKCTECGHCFEKFQSMTDKPLKKCPKCSKPVKRLIGGGAGIIFKGSGFYQTDYKPSSKGKDEKPSCPEASSSCGSGGACPHKK